MVMALSGSAINGPFIPGLEQSAVVAKFAGGANPAIATNGGYILLGDGTGHFTLKSGVQFTGADDLVAGDFNHDGKIDIATVSGFQNTVAIFLGNGDGTFTAGQQYASIFGAFNIGTSDLDGDGNPDLIVGFTDPELGFGPSSKSASYVYFLLGRGDGTFGGAPMYAIRAATASEPARPSRWPTSTVTPSQISSPPQLRARR